MTLTRIAYPSPNYSSRGGASVRLLVLHTAEGSRTIESLGGFFANPASQVSSHAGADDKVNSIGVYVKRAEKAWTASGANPVACQIEACGFTAWTRSEWVNNHPNMLANIAGWLAEEAAAFGVPLVRLTPQQAQSNGRGVCMHRDLGSWGGGHVDVGDGFPIDDVIAQAGGKPGAPSAPSGPPPTSGTAAPPFPGTLLRNYIEGHGTGTWQQRMRDRGWAITVDDKYGGQSEDVCYSFQREAVAEGHDTGGVDGIVGEKTWALAWTKPVT